jgi:undecaprenyl diphosphate synthase
LSSEVIAPGGGGGAAALRAIRARNPEADPARYLPGIDATRIPRHVAIIMDGNGRWATRQGLARPMGHLHGAARVREVVERAGLSGVEVMTLYSFSLENWKRPKDEVEALMALCLVYLDAQERELGERGIRFRVIGRREGLPGEVQEAVARVERSTGGGTRGTLCLAMNYGSRAEIADAARRIATDVAAGRLRPEDVDESAVASRLDTHGLPDPDLLIRTGGELRVSNYLLWQISYAELYVTPTLWPDFTADDLTAALVEFARRSRRYGAAEESGGA